MPRPSATAAPKKLDTSEPGCLVTGTHGGVQGHRVQLLALTSKASWDTKRRRLCKDQAPLPLRVVSQGGQQRGHGLLVNLTNVCGASHAGLETLPFEELPALPRILEP